MRAYVAALSLGILLAASGAWAQNSSQTQVVSSTQRVAEASSPDYTAVYCSSFFRSEKIPPDTLYIVSGEESNVKDTLRSRRLCVHQQRIRTRRESW